MDNAKENLKRRLEKVKEAINETKKRLPAHSAKPPIMMELLALEDKYDKLLEQLKKLDMDIK